MAAYLGVSQPTVTRLEGGQAEPGPISRLLDLLEADLANSKPPAPAPSTGAPPGRRRPPCVAGLLFLTLRRGRMTRTALKPARAGRPVRPKRRRRPAKAVPDNRVTAAIAGAGVIVGSVATLAASRLGAVGRFIGLDRVAMAPESTAAAGVSGPIGAASGFAAGASDLAALLAGARAEPVPGATRRFLLERYGRQPKLPSVIAADTGIPADTIRKALLAGGGELSGPHVLRLIAVYGPAYARAVLNPVPAWAREPDIHDRAREARA